MRDFEPEATADREKSRIVPGGVLILESYSESQLSRDTGGPKDLDMLLSVQKIKAETSLTPILLRETEREVREGTYHTGLASVIQFIGRRE